MGSPLAGQAGGRTVERKVRANVAVHDKDQLGRAAQDLLLSTVFRTAAPL